jgi:hypothetical protein
MRIPINKIYIDYHFSRLFHFVTFGSDRQFRRCRAFIACADLMPDAPEIFNSREASLDLDYITPTHNYLNSQYHL